MSVSDIYRIFVRFGSDTLEGKERYTVGIGVLGILPPYIAKTSEAPVCRGL